ncbi:hypothetical protein GCM10010321_01440 [Streptomyces chartreusis]|nr:hypothetical protein GCM10010321_01440 [Streptomyces chartreusis]
MVRPRQTVHSRFARWAAEGRHLDRLLAAAQSTAALDWLVAVGCAHQHTAAKGGSTKADSDTSAAG